MKCYPGMVLGVLLTVAGVAVADVDEAMSAGATGVEATVTMPGAHRSATLRGELSLMGGYVYGDVTYEIGGTVRFPDGDGFSLHFPISRLEWPIETIVGGVVGTAWIGDFVSIDGSCVISLDEGDGLMKDSDWGDEDDTSLLTIYSESKIELVYGVVDGLLRLWLRPLPVTGRSALRLAVGGGLLVQHIEWEVTDTDQWYPQEPELGHDLLLDSVNATYDVDLAMPYANATVRWQAERAWAEFGVDVAPLVGVEDRDDHLLRDRLSRTSATGWGWRLRVSVRHRFGRCWLAGVDVSSLVFEADGEQETQIYAGPDAGDRWTIDQEVSGRQVGGMAVLGATF